MDEPKLQVHPSAILSFNSPKKKIEPLADDEVVRLIKVIQSTLDRLKEVVGLTDKPKFDRAAYMKQYMKDKRAKK